MTLSPDAGRVCYESAVVPAPGVEGSIWLRQGRSIGFAESGAALGTPVPWFHGTPARAAGSSNRSVLSLEI